MKTLFLFHNYYKLLSQLCWCFYSNSQFLPLANVFDSSLRQIARQAAKSLNLNFIQEGVYILQVGPAYETVAESRMFRLLGADAAGK